MQSRGWPADDEPLFGRWLKKRRQSLGLTQKVLAARADASGAMVRKIEAEERRPSPELARRLAELLGVPPEEHGAFVTFARGGWSDHAPPAAVPNLERPWLLAGTKPRTPSATIAETPIRTPPPDIVARATELQRLAARMTRALAGRAQVAFILGEAGQGKTALIQAFAHAARETQPALLVATGSCNAYTGAGDPYLPFREILRHLIDDAAAVAVLVDAGPDLIGTLVPEQSLLDVLAADRRGDSIAERFASSSSSRSVDATPAQPAALMAQYLAVVARLARARPLLLILDDLHWIDAASVDLLLHLAKNLSDSSVLILGAYRGVDVAQGRGDARHPLAAILNELRRVHGDVIVDLDRGSDRAFIDAWLDREPNRLDEAFRQALANLTSGQPLFTIELLREMQERGDLVRDADGQWIAPPDMSWTSLPARVEGVIDERLGRLAPKLAEWLRVAAVEGEEFTAEVIAHVLDVPIREIARGLSAELSGVHRLIGALDVRRVGGVGMARYRFRHNLIQRRLYETLDAVERTFLHEHVAEALALLHGEHVDEIALPLAHHFLAAGAADRAVTHLRQAGRNARRAGALNEAIRYLETALEHLPDGKPGAAHEGTPTSTGGVERIEAVRERAELEIELAECQWLTGRGGPAQATLAQALARFERIGDADGAGAVERRIARVFWESGMRPEALEHYHRSVEILRDRPENREFASTLSSISQMHMLASEYDLALSSGERALELARRLDAKDVIAHALNNIGSALLHGWPGRAAEGEAKLIESKVLALELGLAHDACRAMYNLSEALSAQGRPNDARHLLQELVSLADRSGIQSFRTAGRHDLFDLDRRCGRWRDAFTNTTWTDHRGRGGPSRSATAKERAGGPSRPRRNYAGTIAALYIAAAHADQGAPDTALELLDDVDDGVVRHGELQLLLPHLGGRIRALAALGRADDVDRHIDRLLEVLTTAHYTFHGAVRGLLPACRWLGVGGAARQRERLAACVAELERLERQYPNAAMTAARREGEGWLALGEGRADQAAERFEDAGRRWLALGFGLDRWRALDGACEALQRSGDVAGARRAFDTADEIVAELAAQVEGLEPAERMVRLRLTRAGMRP